MKNLKEKLKSKKAITLIALVITIVVLIILAGVAINMTIGQNGIFTKAKMAKQNYQNAEGEESQMVNQYQNEIDKVVGVSQREQSYCTTPATTTSTASLTNPCVVVENYRNGTDWYACGY